MKITVTQDDIDKGVRLQPERCPIARALKRTLGRGASVCQAHIALYSGPTITHGIDNIPTVAQDFMSEFDRFDRSEPVQPFSFWLDIGDGAEPFEAPTLTKAVPA